MLMINALKHMHACEHISTCECASLVASKGTNKQPGNLLTARPPKPLSAKPPPRQLASSRAGSISSFTSLLHHITSHHITSHHLHHIYITATSLYITFTSLRTSPHITSLLHHITSLSTSLLSRLHHFYIASHHTPHHITFQPMLHITKSQLVWAP